MRTEVSQRLFTRACKATPGGVNSPVRAFAGVGGTPRFIARGEGSQLVDVDGNRYLDLVGSWGPLILGHAHPVVREAAQRALVDGSTFGASTEGEVRLAEAVIEAVPSCEQVRLVNSGTEAAMSAVRLARGATGRDRVIKFVGHYHGHADALLAAAGSGVSTLGIPGSPGVTEGATRDTILVDWNDEAALREALEAHGAETAAIVAEPVPANMNLVPPVPGFLELLRAEADRFGAVLIFDEVISGFRLARGGAQQVHGVTPDLTVLGKIVGGGFPLAAFGGSAELMGHLAPEGGVYQAGTLSGNPVAVAAGTAQLELLDDAVYERLGQVTARLVEGLTAAFARAAVPASVIRHGTLAGVVFAEHAPATHRDVAAADHAAYAAFFHGMLERGVYLAPSGYEVIFTSTALTDDEVEHIVDAAGDVADGLGGG